MGVKLVIVGGVAGGATAAARARRVSENAEIVVFERGEYISFANCGLPYYIGNVIKRRDDLLLATPDEFKQRYNIDVRIFSEVIHINAKEKAVEINPVYADAYGNLGGAWAQLGDYEKAKGYLQQAIEINKDFADAYHNLGSVYYKLGEAGLAKDSFLKAKEIYQRQGNHEGVRIIESYFKE